MNKILIFADSDSQLYGSYGLAKYLANHGYAITYCIPPSSVFPVKAREQVLQNFAVMEISLDRLAELAFEHKISSVGIFSTGSKIAQFQRKFASVSGKYSRRPYIFTGYNGVVYEKYEEGLFWRLGFDCICINGPRDELIFRAALLGSAFENQPLIVTGLNKVNAKRNKTASKVAIFAEQVAVPNSIADRTWLFERLSKIASHNPEWTLIIKARVRPTEKTFHKQILHPEKVSSLWPANMVISYDTLQNLLSNASLLLTISSTAFFDAVAAEVPVAVIGDFGVKSDLGTHTFINSGVVAMIHKDVRFDELVAVQTNRDYLQALGISCRDTSSSLVDAIEKHKKEARPLPPAMPIELLKGTLKRSEKAMAPSETLTHRHLECHKFGELMHKGATALDAGRLNEAAECFEKAVKRNPSSSNALRKLADVKIRQGKRADALATLELAMLLKPKNQNLKKTVKWLRVKECIMGRIPNLCRMF